MLDTNVLELLTKIDALYNNAWNRLIWFAGGILAVCGIFVPILIQFYQRRFFRIEQEELRRSLQAYAGTLTDQISKDLDKQFEKEHQLLIEEAEKISVELNKQQAILRQDLECRSAYLHAGIFFLQARLNCDNGHFPLATVQYLVAIQKAFISQKENNAQEMLHTVINSCFPHLSKRDVEEYPDLQQEIDSVLKALRDNDTNSRYKISIRELNVAVAAAKSRHSPPK